MKIYKEILQNPLVKIFLSPLASVLVGLSLGMSQAEKVNWLNILLLILITISAQLVQHAFYLMVSREDTNQSPLILYLCEAVLLISSLVLIFKNTWILGLLILLYLLYVHAIYVPHNFSQTPYALILGAFYDGFMLNVIAYYSQKLMVDKTTFLQLAPYAFMHLASLFEIILLRGDLSKGDNPLKIIHNKWIAPVLYSGAIIWGYYQSLPSHSYFVIQIMFVLLMAFVIVPITIQTEHAQQKQNKINYLSAINLIFAVLYSLALKY